VAEKSLREYQEQLEELVEARTHDLSETNTKLSQEISERRVAEEKIRESLEEKQLLLGEIHHRVKNNLQVISSLLDMTRRRTRNEEASTLLAEARSRIYTMALIHSQLYESDHFNRIDMIRHTRRLLNFVSQIYVEARNRVNPVVEGHGVYLSVTQAIPCAIVLNELISNVFKHAYGKNESGQLMITLNRSDDEEVVIHVMDNGRGVPEEVDVENTETLGLKLAKNIMEKQLRGEFVLIRNQGTKISMTFPIDHDDRLIH
jgi:two-component sensor histidine kinase